MHVSLSCALSHRTDNTKWHISLEGHEALLKYVLRSSENLLEVVFSCLTQKTEFSGVNDWNPEFWTLTTLKRNYLHKLQMCINELKLLRTWKEIKRECVFQITKLFRRHMMILLISSMYYTLLPGETGILVISCKIFIPIQCSTKRSNSNIVSGYPRIPQWKHLSRFPQGLPWLSSVKGQRQCLCFCV